MQISTDHKNFLDVVSISSRQINAPKACETFSNRKVECEKIGDTRLVDSSNHVNDGIFIYQSLHSVYFEGT